MIKKHSIKFLLIVCIAIGLSSLVFPQAQTGSIKGIIYDTDGNPIPGASVTVTSEAIMGTQVYVSTGTGAYRFPSLPPGLYAVEVELSGFQKVTREGIGKLRETVETLAISEGLEAHKNAVAERFRG